MKFVVAPDSFKGNMTAAEAADIMAAALAEALPSAEIIKVPIADGGEGSLLCFERAIGGEYVNVNVTSPIVKAVTARFLLAGKLAVIESAEAIGLPLAEGKNGAVYGTSYGLGELILAALNAGAEEIILTLGGSATNDGGAGAAAALGAKFFRQGGEFVPVGGTLSEITAIDLSGLDPRLMNIKISAMCDVENTLCGERGASAVYAPQKGAASEEIPLLDKGLKNLGNLLNQTLGSDIFSLIGGGAAGGLGAGAFAFFGAELKRGIEVILDAAGFDELIKNADGVLTGEGRLDAQSLMGKALSGLSRRTKSAGVPLYVFAGSLKDDITPELLKSCGVALALPTGKDGMSRDQIRATGKKALFDSVFKVFSGASGI